MRVRPASDADRAAWAQMRHRLWDDFKPSELDSELEELATVGTPLAVFIAEEDGAPIGFAELSVRSVAEGAPLGPAAYLEGIWVEAGHRRRGVARALLAAGEGWARRQGLRHLGSDALLGNEASHRWHQAAGFGETVRLVVFGKPL